jgi:hypothetical protein
MSNEHALLKNNARRTIKMKHENNINFWKELNRTKNIVNL